MPQVSGLCNSIEYTHSFEYIYSRERCLRAEKRVCRCQSVRHQSRRIRANGWRLKLPRNRSWIIIEIPLMEDAKETRSRLYVSSISVYASHSVRAIEISRGLSGTVIIVHTPARFSLAFARGIPHSNKSPDFSIEVARRQSASACALSLEISLVVSPRASFRISDTRGEISGESLKVLPLSRPSPYQLKLGWHAEDASPSLTAEIMLHRGTLITRDCVSLTKFRRVTLLRLLFISGRNPLLVPSG